MICQRSLSSFKLVHALFLAAAITAAPAAVFAGDIGPNERSESEPTARRTLAATPSGVDTFSALVGERGVGMAGIGEVDGSSSKTDAAGGLRIWGSFLDRLTVQGDVVNRDSGRFRPSLAVVGRILGDRRRGWGLALLSRYRTEGLTTFEGEIEAGLLGSFAQQRLHLDLGLVAGAGLEEEETDAEAQLRFGYNFWDALRVGFEGRVRRELGEEERESAVASEHGGEWDAFAGAQATLAWDHFFGLVTCGPLKRRTSEDAELMVHVVMGGVAF